MTFKRFPDFGKEVKRPFAVAAPCYDCAAFYQGCKAWRASKEFECSHYQQLPDVKPETRGQKFPEKVIVPADPEKRAAPKASEPQRTKRRPRTTAKARTTAACPIDPKRRCACGRNLPKRRRYCDACREARKRETMTRFNGQHPNRSHRGAPVAVEAAGSRLSAALRRGNS